MIPPELIGAVGGGLLGFVGKGLAIAQKNNQKKFELMSKKNDLQNSSYEQANKRGGKSGVLIRQFMIISALFAVILAPFILAFFPEISTVVETVDTRGWLPDKVKFVEVKGFLILEEVRLIVSSALGFYMGQSLHRE